MTRTCPPNRTRSSEGQIEILGFSPCAKIRPWKFLSTNSPGRGGTMPAAFDSREFATSLKKPALPARSYMTVHARGDERESRSRERHPSFTLKLRQPETESAKLGRKARLPLCHSPCDRPIAQSSRYPANRVPYTFESPPFHRRDCRCAN